MEDVNWELKEYPQHPARLLFPHALCCQVYIHGPLPGRVYFSHFADEETEGQDQVIGGVRLPLPLDLEHQGHSWEECSCYLPCPLPPHLFNLTRVGRLVINCKSRLACWSPGLPDKGLSQPSLV